MTNGQCMYVYIPRDDSQAGVQARLLTGLLIVSPTIISHHIYNYRDFISTFDSLLPLYIPRFVVLRVLLRVLLTNHYM